MRYLRPMKSFGISLLIVGLLVQVMSASLILFNYEVNTASIIEKFCENKDKPELHCDGKCHLAKQIQADSEQKSETPASESELMTFVLTIQKTTAFEFKFFRSDIAQANSLYIEGNYSNQLQSIFHPPQV
ncbi:MAG: hypothetical protein KBF73_09240 [Flavobacteriales bacterium]|nr:hypothetical protein [Flavobacteriales bacterium]